MTRSKPRPRRSRLPGLALLLALSGIAATGAMAAGLNERARLDDGPLGLPLDSLFKQRAPSQPYKPVGESGEANLLPPIIDTSPPPPRGKAAEPEAPLGSALGGRRRD